MDYKKFSAVLLSVYMLSGFVMAQTDYLGNDTAGVKGFMKELAEFIPTIVDVVVAMIPIIFIFLIVGWLTGLFDNILGAMGMATLKRRR